MIDQTRDAFEAWAKSERLWPARHLQGDGEYATIELEWRGWQAATKHAAKVVELMTERRRMNSSQKPDCEYAAAIRQGGEA